MADHGNQTVAMTMPMVTNSVGLPLVTHTVVFNSENVACESVNHNDGAVAIQPQEIKTECYEKEIKEECMDVTPNLHSSDISAFNGFIEIKPQLEYDDAEPQGQLGSIAIKLEVDFEDSYKERPGSFVIIPKPEKDIEETSSSQVYKQHADRFCEICNALFENRKVYNRHMIYHKKSRPFSCRICHLRFLKDKNLLSHMRLHFADSYYPCGLCEKTFTLHSRLSAHVKQKHTSRKYWCKLCGEMVKIADRSTHKHPKPERLPCSDCGKSYIDLYALTTHSCKARSTSKPYPCRVCSEKFREQDERDTHMATHEGERNVACEVCGEYFSCVYYRDNHMNQQHPEAKWHKCDYCYMVFKKRAPFLRHLKTHKKVDDRHKCDVCGARFKWMERLTFHMAEVHDGPLPRKCEECGERFLKKQKLNDHLREKHPESDFTKSLLPPSKKGPSYQCKDCQKSFPKRKLLTRHARQHIKIVKAFKCNFCDSTYKHVEGKVRHTWMKHGGPVPYTCKQCGEGFTAKGEMVEHIKALHGPQREMGKEISESSLVQVAAEGPSEYSSTELTYRSEQDKELTGQGDELNTGGTCLGIKIKTEKLWDMQEDSHVCSDCGTAYTTKLRLMTHACSNPEHVAPQICPICMEGFKFQGEYDGHMATHSTEDECICLMCPQRFNTCYIRDLHLRKFHLKEDFWQCFYCSQTFSRRVYLDRHQRLHTAIAHVIKFKRFQCNLCPARFEMNRLLTHHIITAHGGMSLHRCEICREDFSCKEKLKAHVRDAHQDYPEVESLQPLIEGEASYPLNPGISNPAKENEASNPETSDPPMECETF